MITLREREMKRDVSNNKRITSFRVKIQEPSSGKKRNRSKSVINRTFNSSMSAATATTSSGPPPLFIFRAADAETRGGISLIGGGRAVSVISSNLFCFVFSFVLCVSSRFLWGCFVGKSSKKASTSFKTDTTKQSGDCDKIRGKERERERVEE